METLYVETDSQQVEARFRSDRTVHELEKDCEEKLGIPIDEQELRYIGTRLQDHSTLATCSVGRGHSVRLYRVCDGDTDAPSPSSPESGADNTLRAETAGYGMRRAG